MRCERPSPGAFAGKPSAVASGHGGSALPRSGAQEQEASIPAAEQRRQDAFQAVDLRLLIDDAGANGGQPGPGS